MITRLKKAVEQLDGVSKEAAEKLIEGIEKNRSEGCEEGLPLREVKHIKDSFGISDNYILFGEGEPILPKRLDERETRTVKPTPQHDSYTLFKIRLNLLLEFAVMSVSDIADALGVSRQSINSWKRTGQISKDNARRICAMEGIDYEWLADGYCTTEDGKAALERLYQRMKVAMRDEISRMEQEMNDYDLVCAEVA
jgi:transcriptional regulator with XRE-family HTH domain